MEDKQVLNNEAPENKEQKLREKELNKVNAGGIVMRPSDNNPKINDGKLF